MCLSPSAAISPHRKAKTYTFPANGLYLADIFVPRPTDLGWNTALFAVPPSQSSLLPTGGRRFYELGEKCVPSPKHNQVRWAWGREWTQNQEQRRIWRSLTVFEDYFFCLDHCRLRWRHSSATLPNPPWITFEWRRPLPSFSRSTALPGAAPPLPQIHRMTYKSSPRWIFYSLRGRKKSWYWLLMHSRKGSCLDFNLRGI